MRTYDKVNVAVGDYIIYCAFVFVFAAVCAIRYYFQFKYNSTDANAILNTKDPAYFNERMQSVGQAASILGSSYVISYVLTSTKKQIPKVEMIQQLSEGSRTL